mmetsp:Transcript_13581/g.25503  ORF Transcript_13581/g.25503 Transcript_13581/m.25503 type:complete len:148 (-) Transcript_13581:928-1371(-)
MSYGSGNSAFTGNTNDSNNRTGLSNRYSPYQNSGNYNPPAVSGSYAQQQTQILEDTMRTHYETEATSAAVLSQMKAQRGQLKGAHDNVWEMRQAAEKAKADITIMIKKARQRKIRLQAIAVLLGSIDFLLLIRLIQCGGSFFCRRYK